jgi:hypothetical protein
VDYKKFDSISDIYGGKMRLKRAGLFLLLVYMSILLVACGKESVTQAPATTGPLGSTMAVAIPSPSAIVPTDYSQASHWLTLPAAIDKPVDIFFLYPSVWQKNKPDDPNICEIDDPVMLKYSKLAFVRDATAFETIGNMYAPYYRQADPIDALSLSSEELDKLMGGIPKTDIFAAFDYYIKHYNQGRPYILAGHSQGSDIMIYLLSEYMKANPQVYNRMIAAYVIGWSITPGYLAQNPHLKFAEGPDDTGVIISYNTEAPIMEGKNPVILPGAMAINPIGWTREETLATADQNLGTERINKDGTVVLDESGKTAFLSHYADARVDKARGVIICSTADVDRFAPGSAVMARGIFHSLDYPFYYLNLRENAARRSANFLAQAK